MTRDVQSCGPCATIQLNQRFAGDSIMRPAPGKLSTARCVVVATLIRNRAACIDSDCSRGVNNVVQNFFDRGWMVLLVAITLVAGFIFVAFS
jgi:hypothetical protein